MRTISVFRNTIICLGLWFGTIAVPQEILAHDSTLHASLLASSAKSAAINSTGFTNTKVAQIFRQLYPNCSLIESLTISNEFGCLTANPQTVLRVKIQLDAQSSRNAYAYPAAGDRAALIVISHRLLNELRDPAQLAFVLAHEMSHITHDYFHPNLETLLLSAAQQREIFQHLQNWELTADREAMALLLERGFSAAPVYNFFTDNDELGNCLTHPGSKSRLQSLALAYLSYQMRRLSSWIA